MSRAARIAFTAGYGANQACMLKFLQPKSGSHRWGWLGVPVQLRAQLLVELHEETQLQVQLGQGVLWRLSGQQR